MSGKLKKLNRLVSPKNTTSDSKGSYVKESNFLITFLNVQFIDDFEF